MKVKSESEVTQLCPTLRDPMDHSPPGSSTHGIFQARMLEWGAVAFSNLTPAQLETEAQRAAAGQWPVAEPCLRPGSLTPGGPFILRR